MTASGLPRQRRNELQAVVQRLRGAWSGALTVGRCDAVVVAGAGAVDWQAPKLVVARLHGIPVVASEWLEDSLQRGFLLATAPYELLPPAPARRSSAASTSLATGCPAALTSAAAAAAAVLMAPPEVLQNTQQQQQQQQRAVAPGSPEVELMRDAPQPQSPLAPLFLERSPAAASPLPSASKQLPAAPVVLQDPLLLPASVSAQHRSSLQLDSPWPSPGACHNPLPAQLSPDEVDHGSPADLLPSPLSTASQQNGSTGPLAGGLPGSSSRVGRAAGTPHSMQGEAVTPVGAAAMGGSRSPASTDSDTVVARFMSRFSCITVARGGATTCPSLSSPTANSVGTSICSSLGSSVGGMAESPVIYSPCSMCGSSPALQTREEQEGAAGAPAAPAQEPEGSKGGAIAAGLQPSPSSAQRHWHAQSVMRMRRSLREGLPTTTLVRLGPLLQRPPTRSTLEGLAERHSDGDADGELAPPPATFHASAAARPAGGSELQFVAGGVKKRGCGLLLLGPSRNNIMHTPSLLLPPHVKKCRGHLSWSLNAV